MSNESVKGLLERVLGYVEHDNLTDDDKARVVKETMENYDQYFNPGWLEYRKSVSDDGGAFVEWRNHDSRVSDLYGNEFIDCLGGFGVFNFGHKNEDIMKYVRAQLERQPLHSQELLDPLRGYLGLPRLI